ncbi:hypothetical protein ACO0LB_02855 [Undibacterium sp. SXout7W]|uniref:hypothetical protein n=1 Tax=Undibacterium sp. SXout7W TaxID=3413049 RepID=UPI003BF1709D
MSDKDINAAACCTDADALSAHQHCANIIALRYAVRFVATSIIASVTHLKNVTNIIEGESHVFASGRHFARPARSCQLSEPDAETAG